MTPLGRSGRFYEFVSLDKGGAKDQDDDVLNMEWNGSFFNRSTEGGRGRDAHRVRLNGKLCLPSERLRRLVVHYQDLDFPCRQDI